MVLFSKYLPSARYVLNTGQEATSVNKTEKAPTLQSLHSWGWVGGETEQNKILDTEQKKILDTDTYHKENKGYCVRE